jgi:hypothetical protein
VKHGTPERPLSEEPSLMTSVLHCASPMRPARIGFGDVMNQMGRPILSCSTRADRRHLRLTVAHKPIGAGIDSRPFQLAEIKRLAHGRGSSSRLCATVQAVERRA